MPQAGFNPPFAEGAEFTERKTDAFTNQATAAGPIWNLFSHHLQLNIALMID